jgi:RHS repeat-associated protein
MKDHLGNTRVTFKPSGSSLTTTQVAEYYPFGYSYQPISPAGTNKYLYNGKEIQNDVLTSTNLDWYDYGARFYDPQIGRWNEIDPLAEKTRRWSPYNYCVNNPLRFIDPDGMDIVTIDNQGKEMNRTISKTNEVYLANRIVLNGTQKMLIGGAGALGYTYTKVTVSMSYSGNMSSDNNMKSVGQLAINATDSQGNVTQLSSYSADSGPTGVGSIPNGDYVASGGVKPPDAHGMTRNHVGFKIGLSNNDSKCRDQLLIHPDGEETDGTSGCVGLTGSESQLKDFKSKMESLMQDGSSINLNVNINGNPNFSDCDKNGKKKTHTKTSGN